MNAAGFEFSRQCMKCKVFLGLDDYAIESQTCENKHVFYSNVHNNVASLLATTMVNIP